MMNTETIIKFDNLPERRLGKSFARSSKKMLLFSNYVKPTLVVPEKYDFWSRRRPIPYHDWGNNTFGCCTIASQGELAEYMERLEERRTITIPKQNIIDTYFAMLKRVYNTTEDAGAYENDALDNWRNSDYTFRDAKGRPLTIDAYTKINHANIAEVKQALFLSGSKGIKCCFALPIAWSRRTDNVWDIPEGQQPTGEYTPYSWGGHSMTAIAKYDKDWLYLLSSWNMPMGKISWRAFAIYCDEAYSVVDSVNAWKKRLTNREMNLKALVSDVNCVSETKIK